MTGWRTCGGFTIKCPGSHSGITPEEKAIVLYDSYCEIDAWDGGSAGSMIVHGGYSRELHIKCAGRNHCASSRIYAPNVTKLIIVCGHAVSISPLCFCCQNFETKIDMAHAEYTGCVLEDGSISQWPPCGSL